MNQLFVFFTSFLKNPKGVGAIVPLSTSTSKELIKYFAQRDPHQPCRILEVGAGIGNISRQIAKFLGQDDLYDIVEIDQECYKVLNDTFSNQSQIRVHCLSIVDWNPGCSYDYIISTLPFNSFDVKFVEKIFLQYQSLLKPQGILSYVEYIGLQKLSLALARGKNRENILKRTQLIEQWQKKYLLEKKDIFSNFLPCHVYHLKFNGEGTKDIKKQLQN